MPRREQLLLVVTPMVAVATFAIGLRVGAASAMRAAIVDVAPGGEGSRTFVWQVSTWLDDEGVREPIAIADLIATLRSGSKVATWRGASNAEGVAEMTFDLDTKANEPLELDVKDGHDSSNLARGPIDPSLLQNTRNRASIDGERLAPSIVNEGDVAIDVSVYGGELVAGYATPVFVRAFDRATGNAIANLSIEVDPEAGLDFSETTETTCARGWAAFSALANFHVVRATFRAATADGKTARWYGSLPVAAGASAITLPRIIDANVPQSFDVQAPSAHKIEYVEVDDEQGREFAIATPLHTSDNTVPHATVALPPLHSGLHWIVTSGDAAGAVALGGAAIARPIFATPRDAKAPSIATNACDQTAYFVAHSATGFSRQRALDGFIDRGTNVRAQHRLGVFIGLASLVIAAIIEIVLLLRALQSSKRSIDHVTSEINRDDDDGGPRTMRSSSILPNAALAVGLALLGFGLLAAMLLLRGS
jgi:hypothetical protein